MEGMQSIGEDSGWKQVHGDVFRAPEQLVLFSSMLGTGWQLLLLVLAVIMYAMAGTLRVEEESSEILHVFNPLYSSTQFLPELLLFPSTTSIKYLNNISPPITLTTPHRPFTSR
jgi:Endomembrane protein 70